MQPDHDTLQEKLGPRVSLGGLCPLTPERARRGFRLTQFLTSMRAPEQRERFIADEEGCMRAHGLTDEEIRMVRERAYRQLMEYGACTVAIGKANGALRTTLLERGARDMGLTTEAFIRRRKAANEGYPWHI